MRIMTDGIVRGGTTPRFLSTVAFAVAVFVAMSANAEGTGPFGYPNLFLNPDFESATIAENSHSGKWGYFEKGQILLENWTGYGQAGIAASNDTTWRPVLPDSDKDNYRAFIQMAKDYATGASWLAQTVTPETTGLYAFTCQYATRHDYHRDGSRVGISVICGVVTNELEELVALTDDCRYRNVMRYVPLEAGKSYTFQLYGIAESEEEANVDRTMIIGSCSLELLPAADRVVSMDYHLTGDEDWSAQTVAISAGVKVHLDGHTLKIGYVRPGGNGDAPEFTDETESPGTVRVTVPDGETLPNPGWCVTGGATLVKEGSGTLAWRGGTVAEESPILVTNGLFRLDTWPMNIFGEGGTFTIRGKGQYDVHFGWNNLQAPSYAREFYIEGEGPDGSGAIVNNATIGGLAQHFSTVMMTGDATIGGISRIDFRSRGGNVVGLYGTDKTLTVKGCKIAFCEGESYLKCKDVVITDGGSLEPCNNGGIMDITGGAVLKNGGILSSWANGNTQTLYFPVTVGEGGGKILSSSYWYRISAPITVNAGCTLDCPTDGPWYAAITNETDATINIGGDFFVVGGIFRNDGTVVHTAKNFYFGSRDDQTHPCRVENNGVFRTTGGNFYFRSENSAHGAGVFDLAGSTARMEGDLSDFTGTIRVSGGTASFAFLSDFTGTLVMAGGTVATSLGSVVCPVVFDLSGRDTSFRLDGSGWTTLPENKPVTINLKGRNLSKGDKLLSWKTVPSLVFTLDEETAQSGIELVSTPIGLYYGVSDTDAIYATWTGAAGNGEYGDARNWTCVNSANEVVENGVPNYETIVTLGADVPLGGWETFVSSEQAGPISLNGHRLVIHGAPGSETAFPISDASTDPSHRGEVRFTLGAGTNFVKTADFSIAGNFSLAVDGEGMFTWSGGVLAADVPITVSGGTFKLGVTTADVFGAGGTITVNGKGQFDINYSKGGGSSPVRRKTFRIEGEGPDGSGAIVNNATGNQWGYHFEHVVMTGDATIGGTSRIDFRGNGYGIDGAGHTLTIKNLGCIALCGGTAYLNCKDVVVADGGMFQPCSGCVMGITGTIFLERGGILASYSDKNKTQQFSMPIIVREGGGVVRSDNYWYSINGPITVESGCTCDFLTMAPWYSGAITNKTGATMNINLTSGSSTPYQFVATSGLFVNDGTVNHMAGEFWLGNRNGTDNPCRVENNGTILTSGGNFHFNANSHAHGTGVFELAGGTPSLLGSLSDFTGTIILTGGTASVNSIHTFTGTLLLRDGEMATSLAGFPGTAVIDLKERELPYDTDGHNWLTFSEGKRVLIDVGDLDLNKGDKILSWSERPTAKIRFRLAGDRNGMMISKSDGLFYEPQSCVIFIK